MSSKYKDKDYHKKYRKNNLERLKEYERQYRQKNIEKYKAYNSNYRQINRDKLIKYHKEYYRKKKLLINNDVIKPTTIEHKTIYVDLS